MTPIEYVGLALYRLIFLLGLFNAIMFFVGLFNPTLLKSIYRKLFRLDFDARIVPDDEPAQPAEHLTKKELAELEAAQPPPQPLRVYVAASSRELERVDRALEGLSKIPNVEVTYRWIDDMREQMAKGRTDKDLTREEALEVGDACLQGVYDADLVWLLYPNEPTRGAWVELGYARALFDQNLIGRIVVSYEGRTSAGACPLVLDDDEDYHEALGDQRGLEIVTELAAEEYTASETKVD